MYRSVFLLLIFLLLIQPAYSQENTVGLINFNEQAAEGYILLAPFWNDKTYLVNRCGYIINEWNDAAQPQLNAYLNNQGDIVRGSYSGIKRHNWEGDLEWSVTSASLGVNIHHDIEVLPNGNILLIHGLYYSDTDAIENGRNEMNVNGSGATDGIIEIMPVGTDAATIVWAWNIRHHLVQDYNPSKLNYGSISEHPERLDINFDFPEAIYGGMSDWIHLNSVDYNPTLDQIIISSRHTSEIYIIDHSTSTAEANTSSGGNAGKGGDFLWRWGNPQIYDAGDMSDRKLYGQHDPQWIEHSSQNIIAVFNNGAFSGENSSAMAAIESPLLSDGSYELEDGAFLPDNFYWEYEGQGDDAFYAETESGITALSNGHYMASLSSGLFIEVNGSGEEVWRYQSPVGSIITSQGMQPFASLFKGRKYEPDHPAFQNKELNATSYIENMNEVSEECRLSLSEEEILKAEYNLYPNPTKDYVYLEHAASDDILVDVYDRNGRLLLFSEKFPLDIRVLPSDVYLLKLKSLTSSFSLSKKIIVYEE